MDFLDPEVQERLIKEHHEFKKLLEEHRAADERLQVLSGKLRLNAREQCEEMDLKKAKLRAKDRIYRIVEEFKRARGQS
jgi:uncharacterized protein YdcH (DUF465 family)